MTEAASDHKASYVTDTDKSKVNTIAFTDLASDTLVTGEDSSITFTNNRTHKTLTGVMMTTTIITLIIFIIILSVLGIVVLEDKFKEKMFKNT